MKCIYLYIIRYKNETHYSRFNKDTLKFINDDLYLYHTTLANLYNKCCLYNDALKEYDECLDDIQDTNLSLVTNHYLCYGKTLYYNKEYEKAINSLQITLKVFILL